MRSRVIITIEKCALHLRERVGDGIHQRAGLGVRDELHDDLGVRGGLEVGAIALQARAHIAQVHQVAVVRNGDQALGGLHANGLRVQQRGVACRRVARVADGHRPGQLAQHVVGEDLRDQAHALDVGQVQSVGRGDARRLLPAMLQRIEAEIGLARGIGMAVDGDDAALFAQLVSGRRRHGQGLLLDGQTRARVAVRPAQICSAAVRGTPCNALDSSRRGSLCHAVTSSCRAASSAWAQGSPQFIERRRDQRLGVH